MASDQEKAREIVGDNCWLCPEKESTSETREREAQLIAAIVSLCAEVREEMRCQTASSARGETSSPAEEPALQADTELSADYTKALPSGLIDDTTYDRIEEALDRVDAPVQDGRRWLAISARVTAHDTALRSRIAELEAALEELRQAYIENMRDGYTGMDLKVLGRAHRLLQTVTHPKASQEAREADEDVGQQS